MYDRSRENKRSASRFHSLLPNALYANRQLSASLQDLHSYRSRCTVITEPTGKTVQVNGSNECSLFNGCKIHFCLFFPRLPQEDYYEGYDGFIFSLPLGLLRDRSP